MEEAKPEVAPQSEGRDEGTECSLCGRVGGPIVGCQVCNGDIRFTQKRHFTLSEERQGQNPAPRYRDAVGPERVDGSVVLPKRN